MNRDDIAYSVPSYENAAERYAADESPLRLGELGAGLGLGDPVSTPKVRDLTSSRFPNGCATAQGTGTKCGYGHACVPA